MNADERYRHTIEALEGRPLPTGGGLILERNIGERVVIEAPDRTLVVVTLYDIKSRNIGMVRVNAPNDWGIDREEVWKAKELERVQGFRRNGNR